MPDELRTEAHKIVHEMVTKTIPKKKKCKKAKWLSEEALQIAEEKRKVKGKGRKGKIYSNEWTVLENSKESKKSLNIAKK